MDTIASSWSYDKCGKIDCIQGDKNFSKPINRNHKGLPMTPECRNNAPIVSRYDAVEFYIAVEKPTVDYLSQNFIPDFVEQSCPGHHIAQKFRERPRITQPGPSP